MKRNAKKIAAALMVLFLAVQASPVWAAAQCSIRASKGSVSVDINGVMECAENRYGYDEDSLRRAKQKEGAPQVSIFFDKTDPKEGEKVTATAVPRLFQSQLEQLYYTWYIIHTDENGNVVDREEELTGKGDGTDDEIENGKAEAMGRVARGGFDPILFGIDKDKYESDNDDDDDGYRANYGGANGVGAKRLDGATDNSETEDGDRIPDSLDNCDSVPNQDQRDEDDDGIGDVCDNDIDGDGISNVTDGLPQPSDPSTYDNCPFDSNTNQADDDSDGVGDSCDPDPTNIDDDTDQDGIANTKDNCLNTFNQQQRDKDNDEKGDVCDSRDDRADDDENDNDPLTGCGLNKYELFNQKGVVSSACITRCYDHNFGTKSYFNKDMKKGNSEFVEADDYDDSRSGRDMVVACEHRFPKSNPDIQRIEYDNKDVYKCPKKFLVGDGELSNEEEGCWKLDPTNPDTDGDGVEDEEDLAGLNQQHFTWNYRKGDKVGVIVEGTSMIPTNEDQKNAYYKIMWATPGICSKNDKEFIGNDRCDADGDYGFNFDTLVDVNKESLQNLDTTLRAIPENPQYDYNDNSNSDVITVSSVINNELADERYVYYEWEVYRCGADLENCYTNNTYSQTDIDSNNEKKVKAAVVYLTKKCEAGDTDQDLDDCAIVTNNHLAGIGLNELVFQPRKEIMRTSKEFLKVVLKTKRNESDTRYAISDIVVPITQNDIELELYTLKEEDGVFKLGDKICEDGLYKQMCPVLPYQIVGAKAIPRLKNGESFAVSNYAWQLNGQPLNPPLACSFDTCSMEDKAYFPIVGGNLSIGSISVTAKRTNGENLVAQRMFSINDPVARIYSEDVSTAWYFDGVDGVEAKDVLETYIGNEVSLRGDLIPDYLDEKSGTKLTWIVNDTEITDEVDLGNSNVSVDKNNIKFIADGMPGDSMNVIARIERIIPATDRALLINSWNIRDSRDQREDITSEIKLYPRPDEVIFENETASMKYFLASTVKNAPKILVFVLRMIIGLVLIVSLLAALGSSVRFKEN